jgi:hypothetical protein
MTSPFGGPQNLETPFLDSGDPKPQSIHVPNFPGTQVLYPLEDPKFLTPRSLPAIMEFPNPKGIPNL